MNCEAFRDWLNVTSVEADLFLDMPHAHIEHIRSCDACARAYRGMQEAWLLLTEVVPQVPPQSELESTIMERIHQPVDTVWKGSPLPPVAGQIRSPARSLRFRVAHVGRYVVAASVLALLIGTTVRTPLHRSVVQDASQANPVPTEEKSRQIDHLDQLQQRYGKTELRFVSFESASIPSSDLTLKAQGYIVYDLAAHEAHFYGFDLNHDEKNGYRLVLRDASRNLIASTRIDVDRDSGIGTALFQLPEDIHQIRHAAVIREAGEASATGIPSIPKMETSTAEDADRVLMSAEIDF